MNKKCMNNIIMLMTLFFASTAYSEDFDKFINQRNCDQVIDNAVVKICYNYKMKGATFVGYTLYGELVNKINIKKRPKFYADKKIPERYRALYSDYTHSGYDRGHIRSDADSDYNNPVLKRVYTLAQISPQDPNLNRRTWIKAEKYERLVATKLGSVKVLNGIEYDPNPKRIGRNKIAVPHAFWKMIYNDEKGFKRCLYYKNTHPTKFKGDKLRSHVVDCSRLL